MAVIKTQSLKLSILLVSGLIILSSVFVTAEDLVSLPLLPIETHDFLERCGTNLKPVCGEAIKANIYKNEKLSSECCQQLIAEGWACHDTFVQVTAPYYPDKNNSEIVAKSTQLWHDCVVAAPKN